MTSSGLCSLVPLIVFLPVLGLLINLIFGGRMSEKAIGAVASAASGLAFAVWTIANLAPRARSNHLWYRQTFPDYPAERKALLPGLW